MHPRLRLAAVILAAWFLGVTARAVPAFTVTFFDSSQWSANDAALGVAGFTLEDFEDTTLASGLLIGWDTPAGSTTPANTIPFTFNPLTQDPHGGVFVDSVWDGSNSLLNTRTNQVYGYSDGDAWGDTLISFTSPSTSVGFSLQQNLYDIEIWINGSSLGLISTLTGYAGSGGRFGYVRIDGVGENTISMLRLSNRGEGDGWAIDHLAFAAIPEPSTYALAAGLGAFLLTAWRRRHA